MPTSAQIEHPAPELVLGTSLDMVSHGVAQTRAQRYHAMDTLDSKTLVGAQMNDHQFGTVRNRRNRKE